MKALCLFLLLYFNLHLHSQNIGIGTLIPLAQLHVKSEDPEVLRLESPFPYISFYRGSDYKGYLWYNGGAIQLGTSSSEPVIISGNYTSSPAYFTPNGRLGLGIFNPSEKLDIDGNINLNGSIKINGNAGSPGQVLTSNGTSSPTWTTATSSSNNIRFCVQFQGGTGVPSTDAMMTNTNYNLNPAEVLIGTSTITFNRSGLYHFDIIFGANVTYSASPTSFPSYSVGYIDATPFPFSVLSGIMTSRGPTNTSWTVTDKTSIEIYVPAATSIRLLLTIAGPAFVSRSFGGVIIGHLVSE